MENGSIDGNITNNYEGGGVYVWGSGSFTMKDGSIAGNTANATDGNGGGVGVGGTFTMKKGSITGNHAKATNSKGGGVYVDGGSFTMEDGTIGGTDTAKNTAKSGGGVYLAGGTFEMKGGSVTGNEATDTTIGQGGGGVYVNQGTFTMSDTATVTGNTAKSGGGVYVTGVTKHKGTFNLSGSASVTGNSATGTNIYYGGGGVYVTGAGGTFNMTGGSITDNTAKYGGGGVSVSGCTFNVSGAPAVTGNTLSDGTTANNVNLVKETINVAGKLTDGNKKADIGVTLYTPGVFTADYKTQMGEADPATYFSSDDPAYGVRLTEDKKEAELAQTVVSVTAEGIQSSDGLVEFTLEADNGYSKTENWGQDPDVPATFNAPYGKALTLTAGKLNGCVFAYWTEGGKLAGTEGNPALEWTAGKDRELVAHYWRNQVVARAELLGRDWQDSEEFTFTLTPVGGAVAPESNTVTVKKSSVGLSEAFGRITFTQAGTYSYKVKQTPGSLPGLTYDTEEQTVTFTVSGTGTLTVEPVAQTVTFTNIVTPTITKQPAGLSLTYGYAGGSKLSVTADEREGLTYSYQWYSNTTASTQGGTKIAGATAATYAVPAGKPAGTEYYYCAVTATAGKVSATVNSSAAKVTVGKKTVGLNWANTSFTYDGAKHVPTATATGLIGDDQCSVTVTGEQTDAGIYTATATGLSNANYALPADVEQTFTIHPAAMTVTATGYTGEYDKATHGITVKVSRPESGYTVKYGTSEGVYDRDASPTITAVKDSPLTVYYQVTAVNYATVTGSAVVALSAMPVNDELGNLRIDLETDSRDYNGAAHQPGVTVRRTDAPSANGAARANAGEVIPASEYTVSYQNNVDAGTAKVIITDVPGGNYVVNGQTTFTIEKRKATVTAANQSVKVGESIKTGTEQVRLTGLVQGHSLKSVTLTSTSTAKATTTGTITPAGAVIVDANGNDVTKNYAISYAKGALTVTGEANKADYTLLAQMKVCAHTGLRVNWTKVEGADGYDVYFAKNDCGFGKPVSVTKGLTCKFTGLDKKTVYKAYVQAWKKDGSKKTVIGKPSPTVCAVTGNADKKRTNAAKVTVKKAKLTLKVGKSETIKASVKGAKSGKTVLKQDKKLLRYYSSDRNVATVNNKSGKVKAVGKGSCTIWVVAANGLRTSVKVKVK